MMMMGLHFTGQAPFKDVYIHALVRDEKGQKMSKSKGNVVDPLVLIDQYGADAVRFTLAAMAAQGRDIKLATARIEGYRNFGTKLWNAARFAEINGCVRVAGFDPDTTRSTLNRWALGALAKATAEVTEALEAFRFNDAAGAAYRFVWNLFCDWYLEFAKPVFQGDDAVLKSETQATTAFVLDEACKLLHPFMPFITEELWAIKGIDGTPREACLALSPWPVPVATVDEDAGTELDWIVGVISDLRSLRSELNVPAAGMIKAVLLGLDDRRRGYLDRWSELLKRLGRLSAVEAAEQAPVGSVQMPVPGGVLALVVAGVIDIAAETGRLSKEKTKVEGDASKLQVKLDNPGFLAKATADVVEETRDRLADLVTRRDKLAAAMDNLAKSSIH